VSYMVASVPGIKGQQLVQAHLAVVLRMQNLPFHLSWAQAPEQENPAAMKAFEQGQRGLDRGCRYVG